MVTGAEINKKVSAMNFYSYRLMIREGDVNHTLMCRRIFHQFAIHMYVKIETERLTYIHSNQQQLKSEEYVSAMLLMPMLTQTTWEERQFCRPLTLEAHAT